MAVLLAASTALPAQADETVSATVKHAQSSIGTEPALAMNAAESAKGRMHVDPAVAGRLL